VASDVVAAGHARGVAVVVVASEGRTLCGAAGSAHHDGAAMRADSACNWFSMTKIATATTAALLADRGELDLDAPVAHYLGDVWPAGSTATVRQLLGHRAGLRNPLPIRWVHPAADPMPDQREFLARLMSRQAQPKWEPGSRAAYSNVSYLAIGEVIAAATGRPLDDVIIDELLVPLGMRDTAFRWDRLDGRPAASGYHPTLRGLGPLLGRMLPAGVVGERVGRDITLLPFEVDGAAYGGLIGSALDASRLLALHVDRGAVGGRQLITERSIVEMTDIAPSGGPREFGLGWFRATGDTSGRVEHLGGGMGFWNVMRFDPVRAIGAVVMSNTTRHWDISDAADRAIALLG